MEEDVEAPDLRVQLLRKGEDHILGVWKRNGYLITNKTKRKVGKDEK